MNTKELTALVKGALRGSDPDAVKLHERCEDKTTARKIGEMILRSEASLDAKETWLQAIAEVHPTLAAPFGRELLRLRSKKTSDAPDHGPQ